VRPEIRATGDVWPLIVVMIVIAVLWLAPA
jgi:hypothetical protein